MHWRWRPGTIPFQSAAAPSSLAMVAAVPSRPRYLGTSAPPALFWSWSLTLAVSSGMVHTCGPARSNRIRSARLRGSVRPRGREGGGGWTYLGEARCDGAGGEAASEGDGGLGAAVVGHLPPPLDLLPGEAGMELKRGRRPMSEESGAGRARGETHNARKKRHALGSANLAPRRHFFFFSFLFLMRYDF